MPPESSRFSSRSEVPGEREVEDWICLLPENWPPWKYLKDANPEEFAQIVEEIIAYDLTPAFFASPGRRALELAVPTPPIVLRDALFEGGNKEARKPLREDVALLYQTVPLARFLLSCTKPLVKAQIESDLLRAYDIDAAWLQPYRGDALKHFARAVDWYERNYKEDIYYGRVIAVLQSSGMGKSRLVEQLAKEAPVFSVNFRKDRRVPAGWPPGDQLALKFFEAHSDITTEIRGEELAAAFFGALVGAIADHLDISHLKGAQSELSYGLPGSPGGARRTAFFEVVVDRAHAALREHAAFLVEQREWIKSRENVPADGSPSTYAERVKTSAPDWHRRLFHKFCRPAFERLSAKLAAAGEKRFFLALDECTILGVAEEGRGLPSRKISLIAVQRILKAAEIMKHPVCFWFLLLDTNPSVGMLLPSGPFTSSSRLVPDLQPLPPFVYLDFNQHMSLLRKETASDSLDLENLKKCGRPLWSSLRSSIVLAAANLKLFAPKETDRRQRFGFDPENLHHVFAAFASRACLELTESEALSRFAADAVSRHMRILVSVVEDTLITAAPSEPMLAIAAADALTESTEIYARALKTLVDDLVQKGLVLDVGGQGELCSRILLLLARDMATKTAFTTFVGVEGDGKTSPHVHVVSLAQVLATLLGDKDFGFKEKELAAELRAFAGDKWINLTHFIQYERSIDELTLDELEYAWFVGAGIQCAHNQEVIDGGLVAYAGALDEPYNRLNLLFIPYQTKARKQSAGVELGDGLTAPPILHPDGPGKFKRVKQQTIVLLMDFRTTRNFKKTGCRTQLSLRAAMQNKQWRGYATGDEVEPENFYINVRGHSVSEYPVLQQFAEPLETLFSRAVNSDLPTEMMQMELEMHTAMNPRAIPVDDRGTENERGPEFPTLGDIGEALPRDM